MNLQESIAGWPADQAYLAERGVHLPDVIGYTPDGFAHNYRLAMDSADEIMMAMDAQPTSASFSVRGWRGSTGSRNSTLRPPPSWISSRT